jgi:hypothetical protein
MKEETPLDGRESNGIERREFLRKAALTGAIAAWATPVVQSIAATPAFATTVGTPRAACFHSNEADPSQSCMAACTSAGTGCNGNQCDGFGCGPNGCGPCATYCHINPGNQCCNAQLCDPRRFHCNPGDVHATFTGSISGC